jgi:hypothetical protein
MAAAHPGPPKVEIGHDDGEVKNVGTDSSSSSSDKENEAESEAWEPLNEDWADPAVQHASLRHAETDADPEDDDGWVRNPNNPAEMSRWTGQPSVRGSSDAIRMILLNFCTLGIT